MNKQKRTVCKDGVDSSAVMELINNRYEIPMIANQVNRNRSKNYTMKRNGAGKTRAPNNIQESQKFSKIKWKSEDEVDYTLQSTNISMTILDPKWNHPNVMPRAFIVMSGLVARDTGRVHRCTDTGKSKQLRASRSHVQNLLSVISRIGFKVHLFLAVNACSIEPGQTNFTHSLLREYGDWLTSVQFSECRHSPGKRCLIKVSRFRHLTLFVKLKLCFDVSMV